MKNKIDKLAERDLCYDDTESSKSEEKALLKKQLIKVFESVISAFFLQVFQIQMLSSAAFLIIFLSHFLN